MTEFYRLLARSRVQSACELFLLIRHHSARYQLCAFDFTNRWVFRSIALSAFTFLDTRERRFLIGGAPPIGRR